eukprot:COSAG02_NODE_2699_length_8207_cov_2.313518_6_plen_505_part_00
MPTRRFAPGASTLVARFFQASVYWSAAAGATMPAMPAPGCLRELEAACANDPQVGRPFASETGCGICAGRLQHRLRIAGCTAAEINRYCEDVARKGQTVTVAVGSLLDSQPAVDPNFVGLSIEVGGVLHMIGEDGRAAPLATLLHHLYALTAGAHPGPTLRFGGNSADDSAWVAEKAPPLPDGISYGITAQDLAAYTRFAGETASAANVSLIIDTNFGTSTDPARFGLPHVQAVVSYPGLLTHVSAVEIGNEMDLYFHHKPGRAQHRNASYTEEEYEIEFGEFLHAYEAEGGLPTGLIQAATYSSANGDWGKRLTALVRRYAPHLASVSLHRYATSTCSGKPVSAEELLSDAASRGKVDAYRGHINASIAAGVPFVIGEGNSASCGGQPGVSDTLTSALWSLDFLSTLSKAGARRMNFHGGPGGSYPPIAFLSDGQLQARPLYYGLYLFSDLVANYSRWLATNVSAAGYVRPTHPSRLRQPCICICKNCVQDYLLDHSVVPMWP